MMDTPTTKAWAELEPVCAEITRLIAACPLPPDQRAGLAFLAVTYFVSFAAGEFMKKAEFPGTLSHHARDLTNLVLETIEASE